LKELYKQLELIRDELARLLRGHKIGDVYKAALYSLAYSALVRRGGDLLLLKPLEDSMPRALVSAAKRKLYPPFLEFLRQVDELLESKKPVVVEGEADLRFILEWLEREVGKVDRVLVYDCLSPVEFLIVSAYLRSRGLRSAFLSRALLNPAGLTRFVTQQLRDVNRREVLREVARLIAERLGASEYFKSSYPDVTVHQYGHLGIEQFAESMRIEQVADEVLSYALPGKLLVGTDHGYDLVVSQENGYVYVTHGFKSNVTFKATLLAPLSRLAVFMEVYR